MWLGSATPTWCASPSKVSVSRWMALDTAIQEDRGAGLLPAAVVACIGGTSIGACDDVAAVAEVAPAAEILQIHHRLTSSRVPGPNRAADLPVAASL